jgi:2-keto-4-pentenoate hydratase/2-oxohepta-3-ene-1,7-dioic acid hydratase in catechol pathway
MRFVTFERSGGGEPEVGALVSDKVVSLHELGFADMIGLISAWDGQRAQIEEVALQGAAHPVEVGRLLAPIPRPSKFLCVGLNYRDHAIESGMAIPTTPTIFNKFATAIIGHGEPIVLPKNSTQPDYEAEFAFVIGKGGRHIPADRWREHIFGYTIVNDVSARDFQLATTQWLMGKTFDTFAPFGPALVTADEIEDPHALDIGLRINGEVLQNSNTRELIFKIPELIEFLSSVFTLETGDIVSTGTPPGVGFARKPPRYLRPGDDVVVSVQGLGELRNPVIAEV